jgi:predicted DNA-binding transcriptional regulator YafY
MNKANIQRRWSIEKRLEFIDFQLYWNGQINRSDIMEKFSVSVPQASKDISLYREAAPKNLEYNASEKYYYTSKSFKPVFFEPDAYAYLMLLRDDVNAFTGADGIGLAALPEHDTLPLPRRNINPETLRSVLAAVNEKKALNIFYQSMSSDDPAWRSISPHAFAYDGLRWHVRAYCHNNHIYKDFLLPRILKVGESKETEKPDHADGVWNEIFTVMLKPHPKLSESQAKAVAQDYNMNKAQVRVEVRLALLYYFLKRLNLDDFEAEKRKPREQHVVLANKEETKKALERAQKQIKV